MLQWLACGQKAPLGHFEVQGEQDWKDWRKSRVEASFLAPTVSTEASALFNRHTSARPHCP